MGGSSPGEKELLEINAQIENLVQTVLNQFLKLKRALDASDFEKLHAIIGEDRHIDEIERRIDDLSMRYVQNRAPLGAALRFMFGSVDIAAALERIGDCIEYVARHVLENRDLKTDFPEGWTLLLEMNNRTLQIFEKAASSLSTRNVTLARTIPQLDGMVDALQDRAYQLVIDNVRSRKVDVELALHLVLVVNKLESVADIACHVAQMVVYIVEDEILRHQPNP